MSMFSEFFQENVIPIDETVAYAPSKRFTEKVKDVRVIKDFNYEERGTNHSKGDIVPMAVSYIEKYINTGVIEGDARAKEYAKPIEWQLKAISSDEAKALKKLSTTREQVRKGQYQNQTDYDDYTDRLAVASVVYPDLQATALQDNYGVKSELSLLRAMLKDGEKAALAEKVTEVNGFDLEVEEAQEEIKN